MNAELEIVSAYAAIALAFIAGLAVWGLVFERKSDE